MDWKEILTILVPIMSLMAWVYHRIEKKLEKIEEKAEQRFSEIMKEIAFIRDRLTRLEGRFDERGYWESREYHRTGTEDKK